MPDETWTSFAERTERLVCVVAYIYLHVLRLFPYTQQVHCLGPTKEKAMVAGVVIPIRFETRLVCAREIADMHFMCAVPMEILRKHIASAQNPSHKSFTKPHQLLSKSGSFALVASCRGRSSSVRNSPTWKCAY